MLVWWLALSHQSKEDLGLVVWGLHVLLAHVWVLSGYSGDSKLTLVVSVNSGLFCLALRWTGDLSRVYPMSAQWHLG